MKKGRIAVKVILVLAVFIVAALCLTACELSDPDTAAKFYINNNEENAVNIDTTTKNQAIDRVTDSLTNLREYLDSEVVSNTGYYMGTEFNIDTIDPETGKGSNFRLKIQAHLFTYPYEDEEGNLIYKYYDPKDGRYYDEQNEEGTREKISAQDIHNEVIKKSDILIEWYDGASNQMLIGLYYDGINGNPDDPGNIMYLNIQGAKRSFIDWGDTVLYQQLIRLLMNLSVEKLLVAGNIQGDAGASSIRSLFELTVTDNYKLVLNAPVTSVLFYNITADAVAGTLTEFIQRLFRPFENKVDPFTNKYLGFKFSVMGGASLSSVATDMQFFTQPDPAGAREILTGAYLTFNGTANSRGSMYNYQSDVSFEYGTYPPDDMKLDRDYYTPFEYGQYEFVGNLYIPLLNSNFDALIRTDMQQYDNSTNNVYMDYRDIANGELMIGAYYKNERSYIDISGLEYLYGWIDLNQLGFPKVYDEHLNLAEMLGSFKTGVDNAIISIVDGILSPDKNDKENKMLEYIMAKMTMTEKDPKDIFSKNTETLTVDMELIKHFLEETGRGTYTTRQIINILDSLMPYTMDQIAIMLGVANAEVMLDNTYFTVTLNVDTNEITIKMFTNVGIEPGEDSLLIFQLDITPVVVGQKVKIAEVNFDGFKPLEQIYTYSATMKGHFVFSTAETVDLSKLLSATIGENSGKNTPYQLATNAGISFELVYDQFVTDHEVEGVMRYQGRSAFQLDVYLTGSETNVILRLASDDVAFNNDVYNNQPERADELGYVWVSIECVKDNNVQRIPKVKVREDVFMSSMQAYMNGTSISDSAANIGQSDVNLSITSIIFALIEDAYVVAEPKQLEITSSNETLQNIFRVRDLIGNIGVNAGFRHRVEGLQSSKNDYGMYQVGYFTDLTGNSPYDTVLHDRIPVYFYEDYRLTKDENGKEIDLYQPLKYDFRIARKEEGDRPAGTMQVYQLGGQKSVYRERIDYPADSFFNKEDENNQDVSLVRFRWEYLPFVLKDKYQTDSAGHMKGEEYYYYFDYVGEKVVINNDYVKISNSVVYIYYLGVKDVLHHVGGAEYCYYDSNKALTDENGDFIYIYARDNRNFLFDYDEQSIEITEVAKTQYAPRINGSFMGTIRRYILTFTAQNIIERGKLVRLNNDRYYSEEDENNSIQQYDKDGIAIGDPIPAPIVLYVMEPCEPLAEELSVVIQVNNNYETFVLPARFNIDWDAVTLKGYMEVTDVTIAPETMGEQSFPVRIIVTNREIIPLDTVSVYVGTNDYISENVPVVDAITVDPYDYIIAKNNYFMDYNANYNPDQYAAHAEEGETPEYLRVYQEKEVDFINQFFAQYVFRIRFDYVNSYLYRNEVNEDYIAVDYTNASDGELTTYNWSFDTYSGGNYTEDKISNLATGDSTFTALYLHTYYKGQLIALQVNFEQRILSHIKFGEDDEFDPVAANPGKVPGDEGYIYGHYVANYFDSYSYVIPTQPIFVFTDGAGHYYEKVFDMSYINSSSPLAENGAYVINDSYVLTWGPYDEITYIGSNGSYYMQGGDLVNRPFDLNENVVRDENGTIIDDGTIIHRSDSDVTSTSINWFDLFTIYKPERVEGRYNGNYIKLHLINGDETYNGFMTTELRVSVECPKLIVAEATANGVPVIEADQLDVSTGHEFAFTPSAVEMGNATAGYYFIDPLDVKTLEIPTTVVINFTNADGSLTSKHKFSNVEWFARFDEFGVGHMDNASGVTILNKDGETGKYYYAPSTQEPTYTRIMAKIGSEVSGYQYITVCIRVLSKDPQEIKFFYGAFGAGTEITSIENTAVDLKSNANNAKEFVFYSYYVNTFADFKVPTYVRVYRGANKETVNDYPVTWNSTDGRAVYYKPNTVNNLVAKVGDGEETVDVYLSIVVANHTIDRIDLLGGLEGYYVQVGSADNYVLMETLLQTDYENGEMGLYEVYLDSYNQPQERYIRISTGAASDNGAEAGKIGLYTKVGGEYVLQKTIYPYDFIAQAYGRMSIFFEPGRAVDIPDVSTERVTVKDSFGGETTTTIGEMTQIVYSYVASTDTDMFDVTFKYVYESRDYYLSPDENGLVELSSGAKYTVRELTVLTTYKELCRNYDDAEIKTVRSPGGDTDLTGMGITVRNIYEYRNNRINFIYGTEPLEFSSLVLADDSEIDYNQLRYRLAYYNAHRLSGYAVTAVQNKTTAITDFEGLFYINDVVRPADNPEAFEVSDKYVIGLGTGANSYDVGLKLVFDGGYRMTSRSESIVDVTVMPYNQAGYAQYGNQGYVFAEQTIVDVDAEKQDGAGLVFTFTYLDGDRNYDALIKWYVEESTYDSMPVGSFVYVIPQEIIYAKTPGHIKVSSLTKEGFRIRRSYTFEGMQEEISSFDSTGNTIFVIRDGNIAITDIYNFTPMTTYFAGNAYLPKTVAVPMGGHVITVNNVNWTILGDWYGNSYIGPDGKPVGTGNLDNMTYNGTYSSVNDRVNRLRMATAKILGWEDSTGTVRDSVTLILTISIESAQIVGLPWNTGSLALDTTAIEQNDGIYRYVVDVDAFNNASSSAIVASEFIPPKNITVTYKSGGSHTFRNVTYKCYTGNKILTVNTIPYNDNGIVVAALADTFDVSPDLFSADHIDLKVDVGLEQVLDIRFRFYDKTVDSVSAVFEVSDTAVREQVRTALSGIAADKSAEVLDSINQTRIKINVENLYEQAKSIRNAVYASTMTAEALASIPKMSITGADYVYDLVYAPWAALVDKATEEDIATIPLGDRYSDNACYNYALARMRTVASGLVETYSRSLYNVMVNDNLAPNTRLNSISSLLNDYLVSMVNNGYDAVIGEYLKLELSRVLTADVKSQEAELVSYASYYKNVAEGYFDYDKVIREFYRIKEYGDNGMFDADERNEMRIAVVQNAFTTALSRARSEVYASNEVYEAVETVLKLRLGWVVDPSSAYNSTGGDRILNFVDSHSIATQKTLRIDLRALVTYAFDFSLNNEVAVTHIAELNRLAEDLVSDNIDAIANYSVTVSAIRRNLNTSVDITSMIGIIITRGVNNYVNNLFMEGKIGNAVKDAQSINLQTEADFGYYYIDPYYGYRVVPTKVLVTFVDKGHNEGGFSYTYNAVWSSDPVSDSVTYQGNKKADIYGYLNMFYEALATYGAITEAKTLLDNIVYETVLPAVSGKSKEAIASVSTKDWNVDRDDLRTIIGKSWADIKSENGTAINTLTILDQYVNTFFVDIAEADKENRTLELYVYYRAGIEFFNKTSNELRESKIEYADVHRDYEAYRYDDMHATLHNRNTERNQTLSLIVKVNDRTLPAGDLIVLDDGHVRHTIVIVDNPFEYSVKDLPHKVMVKGEEMDIVWNNVQISPLGNLNASDHTITGRINNNNGQPITLLLYVAKWEFDGIYDENGVMVGDLYFSKNLTYSPISSYEVRFNVYEVELDGDEIKDKTEYKIVTFYPEDSEELVNSTVDTEMSAVKQKLMYVMYWDEMARNYVMNNESRQEGGSLFLGNEFIGRHNITSLSTGSTNPILKKTMVYNYESLYIQRIALTDFGGSDYYGINGNVTLNVDPQGTLPETAKIDVYNGNVAYDISLFTVRLLWNRSYSAAVDRLKNFIEYSYPDVESASREQFAVNILMDLTFDPVERAELLDRAIAYVRYLNTGSETTDEEIIREAKQLLMIEETFDYSKNPSALKGGSSGTQTVVVLARYGTTDYVYQTTYRMRLLFADYTPLAYYRYNEDSGLYERIESSFSTSASAPTTLYIAVRTDYWDEVGSVSAYDAEGKATPYDNISDDCYEFMEEKYSVAGLYGDVDKDGFRLVKVTDITYTDTAVAGKYRSVSFKINGIACDSNLIALSAG